MPLENAVSVETNLYASYVVSKQWRWVRTKIKNLLELGVMAGVNYLVRRDNLIVANQREPEDGSTAWR